MAVERTPKEVESGRSSVRVYHVDFLRVNCVLPKMLEKQYNNLKLRRMIFAILLKIERNLQLTTIQQVLRCALGHSAIVIANHSPFQTARVGLARARRCKPQLAFESAIRNRSFSSRMPGLSEAPSQGVRAHPIQYTRPQSSKFNSGAMARGVQLSVCTRISGDVRRCDLVSAAHAGVSVKLKHLPALGRGRQIYVRMYGS